MAINKDKNLITNNTYVAGDKSGEPSTSSEKDNSYATYVGRRTGTASGLMKGITELNEKAFANASEKDLEGWNYPQNQGGGSDDSGKEITPNTASSADQTWREAIENYGQEQKNYLNEYYDSLKDSSYKKLLNDRISASIAKAQALKNTNTALKANGFGSQGVAGSNYASTNNAYINALGNANSSYNETIAGYNQDMASKMAEISNTQDQYYLNYLQQKANNEREDNEKSFSDFLEGMSAFTTTEAKSKYAEGRIEEKDGKFYLDGRELTANEAARYKNALANLDQSTNSNASVGINGSGVETGSDGNIYADGSKIQLGDDFEYEYHSSGLKYYDKEGHYKETWKSDYIQVMGTVFAGETTVLADLMKSVSYNDGTIFRLKNRSGDCTYAVYKGGKLYHVKDAPSLWDKIGSEYGVEITDSKLERTGNKAKSFGN